MQLNTDLEQRVRIDAANLAWTPSPDGSVLRRMLSRDGAEVARATSIVQYPPGSRFPRHEHALGEEFLVLEGVFEDESGQFPAGTYVRNPPGSGHAPWSDGGCIIFVKLRQMQPDDRAHVVISPDSSAWTTGERARHLALHEDAFERVTLVDLEPGGGLSLENCAGGAEILVLAGACREGGESLSEGSWLRLPPGSDVAVSSDEGCRLYLKTGHLAHGGL